MKKRWLPGAWKYTAACVLLIVVAPPRFDTGASAQEARKTIWDGVYTKEQAKRGLDAYRQQCSSCHLPDLHGGTEVLGEVAPELQGAYFLQRWGGPLSELFIKIDDEMPRGKPGTVTSENAIDIVSYLLEANEARAGEAELPPDRGKLKEVLVTRKPRE